MFHYLARFDDVHLALPPRLGEDSIRTFLSYRDRLDPDRRRCERDGFRREPSVANETNLGQWSGYSGVDGCTAVASTSRQLHSIYR